MAARTVPPPKPHKSNSGTAARPAEAGQFSRLLAVETVPDTGLDMEVSASDTECAALAESCGLVAVHEFEAAFHVRKRDRSRCNVAGRLHARVTQSCVVSLEPFETLVDAEINVDFAESGSPAAEAHGAEDPPDLIADGKIDLGALAAEFLILNLDVYPRKPGVAFDAADVCREPRDENSPFAVLRHRS